MNSTLIKPDRLHRGDTIATVSLSSGIAGEQQVLWRYRQGVDRLRQQFGLRVKEMSHTLDGPEALYRHPEHRASDLMEAFLDPEIKAIITCIGGDDSIRLLPYLDLSVIRDNPKIFLGYSDTTITHLACQKAGITSFYGPCILVEFAENIAMHDYTVQGIERALFRTEALGLISPSPEWTSEYLPWEETNQYTRRALEKSGGYELLSGDGIAQGALTGGCIEVLEMAKGTSLWPEADFWDGKILFLETSEETPPPQYIEYWLRNYGIQGILQRISGMVWGKPYGQKYYKEYKVSILKILVEFGLAQLPVLYNLNFGHASPIMTLPIGCLASIDCGSRTFSVLENGVR